MKNGSTIGLIFTGLLVLVGGAAAGYYFIGGRSDDGGGNAAIQPASPAPSSSPGSGDAPAAQPKSTQAHHLASKAGQFTAPGAPSIQIDETKVTPPKPKPAVPPPPTPVADPEASQAGTNSDAGGSGDTSSSSSTASNDSTAGSIPAATSGSTSGNGATYSTGGSNSGSTSGSAVSPLNSSASTSGSTSGQPASSPGNSGGGSVAAPQATSLYHVIASVVHSESNAKAVESALRHKGYQATVLHQSSGGSDTYTVQVGAYSSQVTADEMVSSLSHDGFVAQVTAGR